MDSLQLNNLKFQELKDIAKDMHIEIPKKKDDLIVSILNCFKEYENYKKNNTDKYKIIKQIGNKGTVGVT